MVHAGFMLLWYSTGLHKEVLNILKSIMDPSLYDDQTQKESGKGSHQQPSTWRIIATGHSLGGALAQLAAFDTAKFARDDPATYSINLTCITYGCPRPGNYAFARRFLSYVPDGWDIMHSGDVVARSGKFVFLYKRAAHRVIVSPTGDIIVRPSYAEHRIYSGLRHSIKDHLLTMYSKSLLSILKGQFTFKAIDDKSKFSVQVMMRSPHIREIVQIWSRESRLSAREILDVHRYSFKRLRRMILRANDDEKVHVAAGEGLVKSIEARRTYRRMHIAELGQSSREHIKELDS